MSVPKIPTLLSLGAALLLCGVVAQTAYVGQGYRYRVRLASADVWVHAQERVDEGATAEVVVPRTALLLFPTIQP